MIKYEQVPDLRLVKEAWPFKGLRSPNQWASGVSSLPKRFSLTRIALLSDTHNFIDEQILSAVSGAQEIWHGGDFGTLGIAEQLETVAPVRGVYGNIDGPDVRSRFPEVNVFMCEAVKVLMIHIGGYPKRYSPLGRKMIEQEKPQLFISGHSHILKILYDPQFECLHMNPGAAGRQGWHRVRTVIRFEIDGKEIGNCRVIEMK